MANLAGAPCSRGYPPPPPCLVVKRQIDLKKRDAPHHRGDALPQSQTHFNYLPPWRRRWRRARCPSHTLGLPPVPHVQPAAARPSAGTLAPAWGLRLGSEGTDSAPAAAWDAEREAEAALLRARHGQPGALAESKALLLETHQHKPQTKPRGGCSKGTAYTSLLPKHIKQHHITIAW